MYALTWYSSIPGHVLWNFSGSKQLADLTNTSKLNRYLVDPAKEAHFGHRLSHASVSSGNETANSSLIRSESI